MRTTRKLLTDGVNNLDYFIEANEFLTNENHPHYSDYLPGGFRERHRAAGTVAQDSGGRAWPARWN
jgi:hypothetical protein